MRRGMSRSGRVWRVILALGRAASVPFGGKVRAGFFRRLLAWTFACYGAEAEGSLGENSGKKKDDAHRGGEQSLILLFPHPDHR